MVLPMLPVRGGIPDDFQSKICRVWRSTSFFLGGPPSWHRTSRPTWCLEAIWDSLVSFPPKSLSLKKGCLGLAFLLKFPQKTPVDFFHNSNQPPAAPRTRHLRLLASTWQAQLLEIWHWHCWNKTSRFDGWNEKKKGRCTCGTCTVWDGNSYLHKWFEFMVNVRKYCIYGAYRTWKTGEKKDSRNGEMTWKPNMFLRSVASLATTWSCGCTCDSVTLAGSTSVPGWPLSPHALWRFSSDVAATI